MPDLNRSQNFTDGDLVTAQKLKDLIDLTTISTSFLYNKSIHFADTLSLNDYLLTYDTSSTSYMKISVEDFIKGGINNSDTGLKFHRYEGGSAYGKTWLYTKTPTVNTYCGFLMESTGGSNGQTINTVNFGTLDVSNSSSVTGVFTNWNLEAQQFQINAGGAISRSGWGNAGSINLRVQGNSTNYFNDLWLTMDAQPDANYASVFKLTKTFDKYDVDGYQDADLGTKTVIPIKITQKVVDSKTTDTVQVQLLDELSVPVINATTVDSVNYKKAGASVVFPIKRGYSEYTFGSETSAYINVPDSIFASGFNANNSFKVNALTSGGFTLWESTNAFKLEANETYFLRISVYHNELSTSAGAWMDYRLRLKAKTVGAATYPMKELAVHRFSVAQYGATCQHTMLFRIRRSDFPTGSEDITRQLQIQFSESNLGIAYRYYTVQAVAEVFNSSDITAGTDAVL